jgi:hypothetical protein
MDFKGADGIHVSGSFLIRTSLLSSLLEILSFGIVFGADGLKDWQNGIK